MPPRLALPSRRKQRPLLADRVEAIEVMGPASDGQTFGEEPEFVALYGDFDVFRTPGSKLVDVVSRDADPETMGGPEFSFPTIGIDLWRDGEATEDTPFFMTVYVSRPRAS